MNGERHLSHYGVRYTNQKIYDRGALDEEQKKIWHHKRYVVADESGAKKCSCKPDKNGHRCNKIAELNAKGDMINPRGKCPNASYHYECRPEHCRPGSGCQNQLLRTFWASGRLPPVRIQNTGVTELGLFASEDIPANTVIGEYTGIVRCHPVGEPNVGSHYAFGIGTGFNTAFDLLIDADKSGNYLRYVNHSCQPNCSTQEVIVNRSFHIRVMTNQLIPRDNQITISYGNGYFRYGLICHCGTENCRSRPPAQAP